MPLSEYEQRVLQQMERQLRSDDPKLASALHGRAHSPIRAWLVAGIVGVAGLGMLVGGVAGNSMVLGVVGFVAMFGAVLLAFSRPRRSAEPPTAGGPVAAPAPKPGLLSRLEQRWDKRRGEQR
jgi:hypothetical protein